MLDDLVDRGIIRILDLVFVKMESDGSLLTDLELTDFDADGRLDLAVFEKRVGGALRPTRAPGQFRELWKSWRLAPYRGPSTRTPAPSQRRRGSGMITTPPVSGWRVRSSLASAHHQGSAPPRGQEGGP